MRVAVPPPHRNCPVRLTKLTQLNLDGTNVTDVSALRELKNLKISGPKI